CPVYLAHASRSDKCCDRVVPMRLSDQTGSARNGLDHRIVHQTVKRLSISIRPSNKRFDFTPHPRISFAGTVQELRTRTFRHLDSFVKQVFDGFPTRWIHRISPAHLVYQDESS